MQKGIFVLVVLTLCTSSTFVLAAADTPETRRHEAERYLQATPPKALFEDMADKMTMNLPPDQRQQVKRMMTAELDIAALTKAMTDAMVKHFTTEELKALADFYGSPIGKSAMQKFGAYMADAMPALQAEVMKAQSKLNQSVSAKSIAALGSKYDRTHSANALLGRMRRTPAVLQACADVKPPLVGTTYISFRFAIPGFGCLYESHKNTNPTTGITISIGRTTPTLPGEKFFATII